MASGTTVIRQPVNIASADLDEANERLRHHLHAVRPYVPDTDIYTVQQLLERVMATIQRGEAKHGMRLQEILDSAHVGSGHVRQRHFTPELSELVELGVRLAAITSPARSVRCEYLYAIWAATGRYRNSLATHRVPKVAAGLRLAGVAASLDDRHLPVSEIPFTTGTRHDYSSDRADAREITRLSRELGRRPNGTPTEHFGELLGLQGRALARLRKLDRGRVGRILAAKGFSSLMIAESMPYGPAPKRGLEGADTYWPGRDDDLLDVMLGAGKQGVAHFRRRSLTGSDAATQAELRAEGFELKSFGRSALDDEFANDADWGVSWWWNQELKRLARVQVGEGTVRIEDWRVFGLEGDLDAAVALVRRHEHPWTASCIRRAVKDTAPGLIKASSYRSDAAQRGLLRLGRAVLVATERVGRSDEAAG